MVARVSSVVQCIPCSSVQTLLWSLSSGHPPEAANVHHRFGMRVQGGWKQCVLSSTSAYIRYIGAVSVAMFVKDLRMMPRMLQLCYVRYCQPYFGSESIITPRSFSSAVGPSCSYSNWYSSSTFLRPRCITLHLHGLELTATEMPSHAAEWGPAVGIGGPHLLWWENVSWYHLQVLQEDCTASSISLAYTGEPGLPRCSAHRATPARPQSGG